MRILLCDDHAVFAAAFSALLAPRGHEVVAHLATPAQFGDIQRGGAGDAEPDVIVTEVIFSGMEPEATIDAARRAYPDTSVAVLTADTSVARHGSLEALGADGVALKTDRVEAVERMLLDIVSPGPQRQKRSARQMPLRTRHAQRSRRAERPTRSESTADGSAAPTADAGPGRQSRTHVGNGLPWPSEATGATLTRTVAGDQPAGRQHSASERLRRLSPREFEVLGLMVDGLGRDAIANRLMLSANTVRTHAQHLEKKLGVHSAVAAVSIALQAGLRPQ
jgi:DNA-binding NarL/FixJ family response regulator